MKIDRIITDTLEENCYIISKDDKCLVVDPGNNIDEILGKIKNMQLVGILITHYHFDHIGALDELLNYKKVDVYDYNNNSICPHFDFEIIKTPGHTSDSVAFYFKGNNIMFTGDFLFKGTIGRTDLPTGDSKLMNESINLIKKYPISTIIYPGHGDSSSLEYELENNIFLQ